jgi:hypothetical protein
MFGDYAKTLPPIEREPTLRRSTPPGQIVSSIAPQLKRFNASVTDRNGRAIGGMRESDFTVYENGVERRVTNVVPTNEPFNLVLLLDVSGQCRGANGFHSEGRAGFPQYDESAGSNSDH